jgi:hypothetical protein
MEIERLPLGQSLADKHRAAELRWRGKPPGIPPDMAFEFMARLKAGSTVRKLTVGEKRFGPGMVSYDRFKKHCELNPIWAAEARKISDANGRLGKGCRTRNLTHCPAGHPYSGENLFFSKEGRRCRICYNRSHNENRTMSEVQARMVVGALREGKTIANITSAGKPSYILNHRALLLFRRKHPKFERLVLTLSSANAKVHRLEAGARRAQVLRAPSIAERGADIFAMIRAEVPINLPAQIRDDVIGTMALEVVEGKLRASDIRRRVHEYVSAQFRQFSKFGPRSLDAALSADGSATLLDTLSTDASTGYWDPNMMASTGRRK